MKEHEWIFLAGQNVCKDWVCKDSMVCSRCGARIPSYKYKTANDMLKHCGISSDCDLEVLRSVLES